MKTLVTLLSFATMAAPLLGAGNIAVYAGREYTVKVGGEIAGTAPVAPEESANKVLFLVDITNGNTRKITLLTSGPAKRYKLDPVTPFTLYKIPSAGVKPRTDVHLFKVTVTPLILFPGSATTSVYYDGVAHPTTPEKAALNEAFPRVLTLQGRTNYPATPGFLFTLGTKSMLIKQRAVLTLHTGLSKENNLAGNTLDQAATAVASVVEQQGFVLLD